MTNDVSARDLQLPKTQFFESKSSRPSHRRPALVLLDNNELKRFGDLHLRLWVNGELRQDALVDGDMVYSPLEALQSLSRFQQLDPGDLLLTGTPAGTALSAPSKPIEMIASLLPPGDEVEGLLQEAGAEPQVPQARRHRRDRNRHRRRCHRPRPPAHGRPRDLTMDHVLWPTYDAPGDLAAIETVRLADRGLPGQRQLRARRPPVAGPGGTLRAA